MNKPDKIDLILQLIMDICIFGIIKIDDFFFFFGSSIAHFTYTGADSQTQSVWLKFQQILTKLQMAVTRVIDEQ